MPKYEVIIYWSDEDQTFIAEAPELSGCAADGQAYKEALADAETVIQEWIETASKTVITPFRARVAAERVGRCRD